MIFAILKIFVPVLFLVSLAYIWIFALVSFLSKLGDIFQDKWGENGFVIYIISLIVLFFSIIFTYVAIYI